MLVLPFAVGGVANVLLLRTITETYTCTVASTKQNKGRHQTRRNSDNNHSLLFAFGRPATLASPRYQFEIPPCNSVLVHIHHYAHAP